MPYWINATLTPLPALIWIFFALGLPYALALLPRGDWRDRVLVCALALALGPALLTAWMLVLGTLAAAQGVPLLRFDFILGGTFILALGGAALAYRQRAFPAEHRVSLPLDTDEKLMIFLIGVALILRWLTTAYWPFTAYDELWVYGYEGKLYTLLGEIPQHIGYYPQFLPLQYTYAQLAAGGVNDHAARAVLPFLHVGSILAVYALGSRLFTRRAGIIAAALWALYPHVGEWAHVGDLEIPQTFLLTLTGLFFVMAWTGAQSRRRYALIAGIVYGIALWTKPTAGAFVWGVILLVGLAFVRVKGRWQAWLPRFEVAFITGLACLPLGGAWYLRNILLGHPAIDLPHDFWLTLARRSGEELGWPVLALVTLAAFTLRHIPNAKTLRYMLPLGLALLFSGILPSIITPHRMMLAEWALCAGGVVVMGLGLWRYKGEYWTARVSAITAKIGWLTVLVLPYFITWFYSYSYHYRLSFAIVPFMLMPTAVMLAYWITPSQMGRLTRNVYLAAIILISLPGIVITLHDYGGGWDWLWTDKFPDDFARYASENPSLMIAVAALEDYAQAAQQQPVIAAPGSQLLPFFFPLAQVRNTDTPSRLTALEGATHFIYSRHAEWVYEAAGLAQNQIVASLERTDVMHKRSAHDDGNFYYEVYELLPVNRFAPPELSFILDDEVLFGGFAQYFGANLPSTVLRVGQRIQFDVIWRVMGPADADYSIKFQLVDESGKVWRVWDAPVAQGPHGYYSTLLWEEGEYILDRRDLLLEADDHVPPGTNYRVKVGLYRLEDGAPAPLTLNGQAAAGDFDVRANFTVR